MKLLVLAQESRHNSFCHGCNKRLFADDPEEVYAEEETTEPVYCSECAAKLVDEDPTRSRSQFYTDTTGTNIDPDI